LCTAASHGHFVETIYGRRCAGLPFSIFLPLVINYLDYLDNQGLIDNKAVDIQGLEFSTL